MSRGVARGLAALGTVCALTITGRGDADGGFVVVVNAENPATTLTRSDLKHLTTGATKQWESGAVVQLGIIPSNAPETQYLASLLDYSPRELLARIQGDVFRGEIRRPAILRSSADCIAFARVSPGGFCVASENQGLPAEARAITIR